MGTRVAASGPDFEDYLEQNRSFAHIAEYIPLFTFTWTGDGEPKLVNCRVPSPSSFFGCSGYDRILADSMSRVSSLFRKRHADRVLPVLEEPTRR